MVVKFLYGYVAVGLLQAFVASSPTLSFLSIAFPTIPCSECPAPMTCGSNGKCNCPKYSTANAASALLDIVGDDYDPCSGYSYSTFDSSSNTFSCPPSSNVNDDWQSCCQLYAVYTDGSCQCQGATYQDPSDATQCLPYANSNLNIRSRECPTYSIGQGTSCVCDSLTVMSTTSDGVSFCIIAQYAYHNATSNEFECPPSWQYLGTINQCCVQGATSVADCLTGPTTTHAPTTKKTTPHNSNYPATMGNSRKTVTVPI